MPIEHTSTTSAEQNNHIETTANCDSKDNNNIGFTKCNPAAEHPFAKKTNRKGWQIKASYFARNTHNRIRAIVESIKMKPNPEKPMIPLSIGKYKKYLNLNNLTQKI